MRLVLRPIDQSPGIAAIGEDVLYEGEPCARAFQHALCAVAVLNVGGMDLDCEQTAVGIGQDMALASIDLLSGVVTFESPF